MTSTVLDWIRSLSWSDADVRGTAYAVLATLALIVALKLLASLFRQLRERYWARLESRRLALRVQRWELVSAGAIQRVIGHAVAILHVVAAVVLIDIYVALVLSLFPATQEFSDQYFDLVTAPVIVIWHALVDYLPNALEIAVFSGLAWLSLKFLRLLFGAVERGAVRIPGFYTDWADPTYKLVRALVLVFVVISIFPRLPGADERGFQVVSLFVGALLTLGSTAAVGNAVAGVVLTYTRAFQVGDWIQVGQTAGEVVHKTLLVTRLRTATNELVTVPNGEVLRVHVVNFTPAAKEGRLSLTVTVTIGYDVDWRTVEELLLKAAKATSEINPDPPPSVLQTSLDDFGVSYLLKAFTGGPPPLGQIRTALGRNILDEFNRAGVEILTPGVSVIRSSEPPTLLGAQHQEPRNGSAGEQD